MFKRKIVLFLFLFLLTASLGASGLVSYFVYTLEEFDSGEMGDVPAIPHDRYLYPHYYSDMMGDYPGVGLDFVLKRLRELKPDLYRGIKLVKLDQDSDGAYQKVIFFTPLTDKKKFMVMVCELTYSLSLNFDKFERVIVTFQFQDKKLEKTYGGKEFTYQDVPYAGFVLQPPRKK